MIKQNQLRQLRSRLTRAKNSNDPRRVVSECDRALAIFAESGYPDCWANWQRSRDDAEAALRTLTHLSVRTGY